MDHTYDVIVVGGGVCGATIAHTLSAAGKRVVLLDAGTSGAMEPANYRAILENYYGMGGARGLPNGPYPINRDALSPGTTDPNSYYVQRGSVHFMSDYLKMLGGSTLHWQGTALRMVPNDFRMQSQYGRGVDWPISYDDLEPHYREAERILGVSADVDEQKNLGVWFPENYEYPMSKMPQSVVDQYFNSRLQGVNVALAGGQYPVRVVPIPVARNSKPNPRYDGGRGYIPVSAIGDRDKGNRCQGNSNCLPLCPVQAKYNALKTIRAAQETGRVEVRTQCIATRVLEKDGRVTGVEYKRYADPAIPAYKTERVSGAIVVLAANAIQNAVLMLASQLRDQSGQLGKNLMDHPYVGFYGLSSEPVYPFRGPDTTSGVESLRDGAFRSTHASFRASLANWGWSGEPGTSVSGLLNQHLFGPNFRDKLRERMTRMVKLGVMFEQLPNSGNTVTINPLYQDQLGNFQPVLNYSYDDYTLNAVCAAMDTVWPLIMAHACIEDQTAAFTNPGGSQPVTYQNRTFHILGSGHLVGTHRIGKSRDNSVTDSNLRCWEYPNLYAVGPGSMVTVGTSNPTLTSVALSVRAAEAMLDTLG
jgi:choline dehydrogenase-like flavoprotein